MSRVCAKCRFDNPPTMRYCGMCGAALAAGAPAAAETSPDSFSTQQLGVMTGTDLIERFRKAGLEAGGQRRIVTVLFVDLAGFTQLSEQIEVEELFGLIQRMTSVLANAVYKYEGAVDKFTGDGLMALFGAPIAHENHAELAVRSALDMQTEIAHLSAELYERLGVELRLHVGLHTGPVIVGSLGSEALMNYTAIGDTVNMARRIEEASAADTLLVSETVYQQTKAMFNFEPVPPLTLKGINRPVPAYRVLTTKAERGSTRGIEGLHAPLIGRAAEMKQLLFAIEQLAHNQRGHLVVITGEAGMGKSRLTAEVKTAVLQEGVTVLAGQSLTYRRSAAYWIFIDALRNYLQVGPASPEEEVRARLTHKIKALLGPLAGDTIPYLEHLLSLKPSNALVADRIATLEGGWLRQQMFRAVREWLVAETQHQPVLLLLEDLHWADEVSLDLLTALLDTLRQAPLFICAVARPTQEGQLPVLLERAKKRLADRFTLLELRSLPIEDSAVLLQQLMNVPDLPEKIRDQILQRSGGIPFYMEEILRMLIDAGVLRREGAQWRLVASVETMIPRVPDTLQDLILARFDRLSETHRHVLQVGAVIGRQFSWPMLMTVLQQPKRHGPAIDATALRGALVTLARREFILPLPHAPESEFEFKHALVSDAIYSTLLRRDRSELHELVAQSIEQVYAAHVEEQIEVLARHYGWSARQDKALHYLILAGQKALREFANDNARRYYTQALNLLPQVTHTTEQQLSIHSGLGDVLTYVGEYEAAREQYETALGILPVEGAPEGALQRSRLERRQSRTFERQGNHDDALMCLSVALDTLQDVESDKDYLDRAQILSDIGWIHFRSGNHPLAEELLQRALHLVEHTSAHEVIGPIYNRLGGLAYAQNDWQRAAAYVRKSIAILEAIGDLVELATALGNLGLLEVELCEYDNALTHLTRGYELKNRQGRADGIAVALSNLGIVRLRRGELPEAKAVLAEAYELARQIGYTMLLGYTLQNIGEVHLTEGNWPEAQAAFIQSVDLFLDLKASEPLYEVYRSLGETALAQDNLAEADKWAERVEQLVGGAGGNKSVKLSAEQSGTLARFRGRLAIRHQNWETALESLHESQAIFQKTQNLWQLGKTHIALGEYAALRETAEKARQYCQTAQDIFTQIGARREAWQAERSLVV